VAIYTLDIEDDYEFDVIGISSHEKPYRLAWSLNRGMNWMMSRRDDILVQQKSLNSGHAQFRYVHPSDTSVITLIDNKTSEGLFLPEINQFDFILKLENMRFGCDDLMMKKLRACAFVITAYPLQIEKLKSKQNLIFEYR
jgi:hypothetical protein